MIIKEQVCDLAELLIDDFSIISKRMNKQKVQYLNLACGFDIETSSFYVNDKKQCLMYIWQFGIDGKCCIGRTWDEFFETLETVKNHFDLSYNRRLVIYVHNLPYEFQWIRHYFEWDSVFAREERKVMKAVTTDGFEFRCSYVYTALSLEKACEQLTKFSVTKKVGQLDYTKVRTPLTPLTKEQMEYCLFDVLGVMAIVQEAIEQYGDITKIPLTNTGKVRRYCQEKCLADTVEGRKYHRFIHSLNISGVEEYDLLKRAFTGGFTHANYRRVGKTYRKVKSYDFTSSYPTVMVAEQFPMSSGRRRTDLTVEEIRSGKFFSIFNARFKNIREKENIPDHYISAGKCFNLRKPFIDNGRIISAEELVITLTDIDLEIIDKCYDYDGIEIGLAFTYAKGYLPKDFVDCILSFYEKKTTLKDVEGEESFYMLFKGMLNSTYGMTVTDIVSDTITYGNDWGSEPADSEEQIEKYNSGRKRFLFYPWGVYVTAFARKNLWSGILECGQDYIYADTDSIKILNAEAHQDYINKYNEEIISKLETACKFHNLDTKRISPKTVKGKLKPLGVWDDDGDYDGFKTLGAKRYLVEKHGDFVCTIAGVNKKMTSAYIGEHDDPWGFFTDEMTVDEDHSGRLISTYIDKPFEGTVADYKGVCYNYKEMSGIHLEKSDYNLKMSKEYLALVLGMYISEDGED